MIIRQIALVAAELEPVVSQLTGVFGLEVSFRDPGVEQFGLHNSVLPIGTQFLEVVSPFRQDTTAGRYLVRRGGDAGYMLILQSEDLAAARRRVETSGVRIVWEIALEDIATIHLHPRDVGGALVSIDQPQPTTAWRWGGPDWQAQVRTDVVSAITAVTIQAKDPLAMAARYSELFDLGEPRPRSAGCALALESGEIRFVAPDAGSTEGISAIGLRANDAKRALDAARRLGLRASEQSILLGGVRFDLEAN
jgi:Glyoxalase-like domain